MIINHAGPSYVIDCGFSNWKTPLEDKFVNVELGEFQPGLMTKPQNNLCENLKMIYTSIWRLFV